MCHESISQYWKATPLSQAWLPFIVDFITTPEKGDIAVKDRFYSRGSDTSIEPSCQGEVVLKLTLNQMSISRH
jgi:hypothetical protein